MTISTVNELRAWVDDHVSPTASWGEIDEIVEAIRSRDDCPAWGDRWGEFFRTLPANLSDLVDG